jgi:hypothetical protein
VILIENQSPKAMAVENGDKNLTFTQILPFLALGSETITDHLINIPEEEGIFSGICIVLPNIYRRKFLL